MTKKIRKEHKKSFDQIDNPDSIWNRGSSNVGGKQKSLGGKEIMQMLGIDHEKEPESVHNKSPLKMMDIVMQTWDIEGEKEEDNEEEDNEEEVDDEEE